MMADNGSPVASATATGIPKDMTMGSGGGREGGAILVEMRPTTTTPATVVIDVVQTIPCPLTESGLLVQLALDETVVDMEEAGKVYDFSHLVSFQFISSDLTNYLPFRMRCRCIDPFSSCVVVCRQQQLTHQDTEGE